MNLNDISLSGMPCSDALQKAEGVGVLLKRAFFFVITSPTHTNATPPSCAKYHDAKPEVLGAQVPLYSAWCLVILVLPSILSYAKRFFSVLKKGQLPELQPFPQMQNVFL